MSLFDKPTIFTTPFAENGEKTIPPLVQSAEGRASLQDGFPVETGLPIRAGGIPPSRADINGALYLLSQHTVYGSIGGTYTFEAAVAEAGGYPKGAVLAFSNPAIPLRVRSLIDGNKDDFNTGAGVGTSWVLEGPGVMAWSPGFIYMPPCLVFGADGKLYTCLQASGPGTEGGARKPGANAGYWVDYASTIQSDKYDIGQYYWFEDELARPGLVSCLGGTITDVSKKYPKILEYLQTAHGQKRCVTKAEYDALHVYSWHTCADGTKISWDGIGGVNKFVLDLAADTLQLPDLAGMSPEMVGDSLGVGAVHGDAAREITGSITGFKGTSAGGTATGPFTRGATGGSNEASGSGTGSFAFTISRVVPVAAKNQVRSYGSLACVYLGNPAS